MTDERAINTLNSIKQYYNDKNEDSYVGFDNEDNEALDMAIKALEKDIPKKPISKPDGFGYILKVCPNCETVVHDPDWRISTQKEYFTRRCQNCGQLFTKLGEYIGNWEDEE